MLIDRRRFHVSKHSNDQYLTFEALEAGTFTFTIGASFTAYSDTQNKIEYSIDEGSTWVTTNRTTTTETIITTPTIPIGGKVLWRSNFYTTSLYQGDSKPENRCQFSSTGRFNVYGNICSLFYLDTFWDKRTWRAALSGWRGFTSLFENCTGLVNAESLLLPLNKQLQTNGSECTQTYRGMFKNCNNLISIPNLSMVPVSNYAFYQMFMGCTSLTNVNQSLTSEMSSYCCYQMFSGCTSLTTAPILPATILVTQCYNSMFDGCTSLNNITMLAEDISATNCLYRWVRNVASTGTFTKSVNMTSLPTGVNGIPSGWSVESIDPNE